jgi:signal transduction histidine kinase
LAGVWRDTSDLEALMNRTAAAFRELAHAERCALFLGDEVSGDILLRAAADGDGALDLDEVEEAALRRTLAAIRDGRTFSLLNGDLADERAVTMGLAGGGAADYLVVGLHDGSRLLGVVYLHRPELHEGDQLTYLLLFAEQAALALANARLREEALASRRREHEFVAVVNHQLRVPMTAIRGYADLLSSGKSGPLNERQVEFLERIRRNVDRMAVLVSDLGTLSRYEAGRVRLDLEAFDVAEAAESAVGELRPAFEARQQRLTVEAATGLPQAFGSRQTTARLLGRLLSNANLYARAGSAVTVRITADRSHVLASVSDDGPGILAEDQERLFTPFFRSEDEQVRQQPGWGLGLALARHMAEAQGGRITLASAPGQGATFTLALPVRAF